MNQTLNNEEVKGGCGCGPDCCGEETLVETGRPVSEQAPVSRTNMPVAVPEASSGCCGPAKVESGGCC